MVTVRGRRTPALLQGHPVLPDPRLPAQAEDDGTGPTRIATEVPFSPFGYLYAPVNFVPAAFSVIVNVAVSTPRVNPRELRGITHLRPFLAQPPHTPRRAHPSRAP